MTAKKKSVKKGKKTPGKPRTFFKRLFAGIFWLLLIAAILYGAAVVLSRTEGFRSILEEQIEEQTGVEVNILHSELDWKLNLHLDDIASGQSDNTDSPLLEILHVDVDWSLLDGLVPRIRNLNVAGAEIRLVQDEAGQWQPSIMAPLADKVTRLGQLGAVNLMMRADHKAGEDRAVSDGSQAGENKDVDKDEHPAGIFEQVNVTIEGAAISWWSSNRKIAEITGLDFVSRVVQFPGRNFQYYKVAAACAELGNTRKIDNISFEMLSTKGRNIVLGPKADWKKKIRAKNSSPAKMELNDEMSEAEKAILAEAEAVLNREPVYEETELTVSSIKKPTEPEKAVVETVAVSDIDEVAGKNELEELETIVIEEEFDIAAFDDLSEDESEALVEYIQEMLEIDPTKMGSELD